ncbi:Hypothetical protein CINCED_3A011748 [Cinara cedri]|uniref:Uncharacterized protein n=1 Tax=Cinara cedri TaxID=506608 RepID=A0A5E4MCZ8_9HEMI|nr:Hypothetical protein CINCED_3A011748 [Cinara cedri]
MTTFPTSSQMMSTNSEETSADSAIGIQFSLELENNENVKFVFDLLDDINRLIKRKPLIEGEDFLTLSEIHSLIDHQLTVKEPKASNHAQRITHFILYLNTKVESADWVKEGDASPTGQNLLRYIHGKPISVDTYYKVVEILNLKSFMAETIMCTPYGFCRDLIDINLNQIKYLDSLSQLIATEDLILSLMKSIKRQPVKPSLEDDLLTKFNEVMIIFSNESKVLIDLKKLYSDDDQKEIAKYNGYRVRSIFKIFTEVIRFQNNPGKHRQYPMYTLKPIRSSDLDSSTGNTVKDASNSLFHKLFTVLKHKCMEMCDFSIDTWLSWYEVEVIEEDTNLQACVGHLIYDLCSFIDKGIVKDAVLTNFRGILRNMSIEKLDFSNVDITDINGMIENVQNSSKFHISAWIKKMIQNTNVYTNPKAVSTLDRYMKCIDYNCLRCLIDSIMNYYKNGGIVLEPLVNVLYKGVKNLDMEDKSNILKHFMKNYADVDLFVLCDYDKLLSYIAHNEYSNTVDIKEMVSKLIWLAMLQPKKMLHKLVSQYITGIYRLPVKGIESKRSCLHQVTVDMHLHMPPHYVYEEYRSWLDVNRQLSDKQKISFRQWSVSSSRSLHLMKPKHYLMHVLTPLLKSSPNYVHTLYLVNLTKLILNECHLITLSDIDNWDKLLIQLAMLLEDTRWNIENFSRQRVELCEKIIVTIQPILNYAAYIVKPSDILNIKGALKNCHLLTVSHFLRMWGSEYIVIEGMDEQFIMTVQSQSHISFSNLNMTSTQKSQEEFIFSIATYMPKFTLHEMKSFIANYLNSAKQPNIQVASFFLFDSVMNALMRIIVYMKTANRSDNECSWNYVENTIVNFLDAVNTSRMCSIYNENTDVKMAMHTISKVIMVIKQIESSRQFPLFVVIRRLIDLIHARLDVDRITRLLIQIASIKTQNCKDAMGYTVEILLIKLRALNMCSKQETDK